MICFLKYNYFYNKGFLEFLFVMDEEIEILQSIYLDDIVRVDLKSEKSNLEVLIYPLDDEEESKKNLRLNLIFHFTKEVNRRISQKFKIPIMSKELSKTTKYYKLI